MDFRVLGPLEVVDEGRTLELGSGRQLALVAMLLLHANEVVSVERIVDELWSEAPPPTAAKIVRNSVSLLRRELGDRIVTRSPGYMLRVGDGELDAERLERAVRSGDPRALDAALALRRGPPLSQFAFESFAQDEIARLEELWLTGAEARIDAWLGAGEHERVVGEAEPLVRRHPLRERLVAQLMLALYRSGRQADALATYERARRELDTRLGVEPGPPLKELQRQILNQDDALEAPRAERSVAPAVAWPRSLVLAAAGLALAAAAGLAFVVGSDRSARIAAIPPNYVGVVEAATNEVVAVVPVGIRPGPIAFAGDAVWVANVQDRTLTKIDHRERSPVATIALLGRTPTDLAAGAGALWVAHGLRGQLSRVEPQFGRLTTMRITDRAYASPNGAVDVGAGAVWAVYGDSTLARIAPTGGALPEIARVGGTPVDVVVGGGGVWVASSGDATVRRYDPATFTSGPLRTISVGSRPTAIAYGEGALWVANGGDGTVTRVEPSTGATSTIRVGTGPRAVAVGAGAIWVANAGDGTVMRIDPGAREVTDTIGVGSSPVGLAVADGFVWVTSQAASDP